MGIRKYKATTNGRRNMSVLTFEEISDKINQYSEKIAVNNGVLSFSFTTNTPTTPATIPTFDSVTASNTTLGTAISVTPAVSNASFNSFPERLSSPIFVGLKSL